MGPQFYYPDTFHRNRSEHHERESSLEPGRHDTGTAFPRGAGTSDPLLSEPPSGPILLAAGETLRAIVWRRRPRGPFQADQGHEADGRGGAGDGRAGAADGRERAADAGAAGRRRSAGLSAGGP